MEKYVVVKTHNFDSETEATEFMDYREAVAYLHWYWEDYYDEEIACGSDLDKRMCYHEANYGRVQWNDGDYTEFNLIELTSKSDDFPKDWEKYVCD